MGQSANIFFLEGVSIRRRKQQSGHHGSDGLDHSSSPATSSPKLLKQTSLRSRCLSFAACLVVQDSRSNSRLQQVVQNSFEPVCLQIAKLLSQWQRHDTKGRVDILDCRNWRLRYRGRGIETTLHFRQNSLEVLTVKGENYHGSKSIPFESLRGHALRDPELEFHENCED